MKHNQEVCLSCNDQNLPSLRTGQVCGVSSTALPLGFCSVREVWPPSRLIGFEAKSYF